MKTRSMITTLTLAVAILLAAPFMACAGIIATDDFESYAPGDNNLQGGTGGTGWAAGWLAPGAVGMADVRDTSANPLAFTPSGGAPSYGATRAMQCWNVSGNVPIAPRQLATPLTSTFYVAYLFRYESTNTVTPGSVDGGNNTFSLHFSDSAANTSTLNFGIRYSGTPGGNDFMVRNGTGTPAAAQTAGGSVVNSDSYLLVAKMTKNAGVFNQIDMWINPARSASDAPDITLSSGTLTSISHVFFRGAANQTDDRYLVDNLLIGETWNDVVPAGGPGFPQVRVETAADGSGTVVSTRNITAGDSIAMYAIARDAGGAFITNTPAIWSFSSSTGGIVGGDLAPADGGRSAVFTAHITGTATVRASANATTLVDTDPLTVVTGPAKEIRVETAADGSGEVAPAQNSPPGIPITVYSVVRDAGGNFMNNSPATWSLSTKTSGVVGGDLVVSGDNLSATFTGNLSGTATIRATAAGLTAVDSGVITVSRSVTWVGDGSLNQWNFTAANWTAGSPVKFLDMDDVTFDGNGSQSPAVNIIASVSPLAINVVGGDYTLGGTGKITGQGGVTNAGGGTLTLLTTNDYSGLTVISYGMLQLGNGVKNGSLGSGNVVIGTGGTSPVFNRTDPIGSPYVVTNSLTGPADFLIEVKSGAVKLAATVNNTHATAIVRNGGTLILANPTGVTLGNSTATAGATVLNIEAGGTAQLGVVNAGGDHITGAGKTIQIDGTFDANGVSEAFGVILGGGIIDNSGVSNAVLTVCQGSANFGNAGDIFTFSGIIRNTGLGTLALTKDSTNTLILTGANTFNGDTRVINGGILELGNVNALGGSTLNLPTGDSGSPSFGSLTSASIGGLKGAKALGLTNASGASVALTLGANGQNNTYSGSLTDGGRLTKSGTGTQTLSGANTYSGATTVSSGALLVNGSLAGGGTVTVGSGATLGGSGVIAGATLVQNGGSISPGTAIGTLTINNTATLQGMAVMQLNRTNSPNSDNLAATSVVLGGTLTVTNLGPALKAGDSFTLFTGGLSGSITTATLPALSPGLSWNTSSLNSAGVISVTGAEAAPSIAAVGISGGNLVLTGAGGSPGAPCYWLSSTNVAAPKTNWLRVATNVFAADGKFTNSIPMDSAVSQNFFRLEIP